MTDNDEATGKLDALVSLALLLHLAPLLLPSDLVVGADVTNSTR
jgi:hypothetical protein